MTAQTVDEYIVSTPQEIQPKLNQLRTIIKEAEPEAIEKISYSMPYYHYKGRLAYFGLATHHIGLYIPPPIIAEFKEELKSYYAKDATLRLPLDKDLPVQLIKKLIRARAKKNEKISK